MPSHSQQKRSRKNRRGATIAGLVAVGAIAIVAISYKPLMNAFIPPNPPPAEGGAKSTDTTPPTQETKPPTAENPTSGTTPNTKPPTATTPKPPAQTPSTGKNDGKAITVAANPNDIAVLVNKQIALPDGYAPTDLVEPNVAFIFSEKSERRLMRTEAAKALEEMFAGAKKDGIFLAGVSGYRSRATQEGLFNYYVQTQGEETARRYSAQPRHSEHETGLAMDISGSTGKCAADDCFAGTPEANWLEQHAPEYGFIIRYPKGKESITGYAYEAWHVRYLGKAMAQDVTASGKTLDEYLSKGL